MLSCPARDGNLPDISFGYPVVGRNQLSVVFVSWLWSVVLVRGRGRRRRRRLMVCASCVLSLEHV